MSARETLAAFVAAGNLRDTEPSPEMDPERAKQIRERMEALREVGGKVPAATDAPSDFRAGVEAREAKAAADVAAKRGLDVPRPGATNAILKRVYGVHDAISSMPAPGGMAAILFIILVFFLVLIPITTGGPTRLLLLWDVLLGQKEVPPLDVTGLKTDNAGHGLEQVAQAAQKTTGQGSMGGMKPLPSLSPVIPPLAFQADVAPALGAIGTEGYFQ